METERKLRILCLHGYHQNKNIFRQKTGSFRKPLKKVADFDFLDAPHLLSETLFQEQTLDSAYHQKVLVESNPDGRGWWLKSSEGKESLQESLKTFETFLDANGPFDGIVGFSQGAAFLGLVCILLGKKYTPIYLNDHLTSQTRELFNGARKLQKEKKLAAAWTSDGRVLAKKTINGPPFRVWDMRQLRAMGLSEDEDSGSSTEPPQDMNTSIKPQEKYYKEENKIDIPSLHVIGDTDEVISSDRSRDLAEIFNKPQIITHTGGHYVPASKEIREVYKQFIEQFIN